jgi:ribosomal protein L37AE/L43A
MNAYRTRYHRDGTVTVWNVVQQQWLRVQALEVPDAVCATLSREERDRIERHGQLARAHSIDRWTCSRCRRAQAGGDYYETRRGTYWCPRCAAAEGRELTVRT